MDKIKKNKLIDFDKEGYNLSSYATSKGNLPKWKLDEYWYKVECFGYESLSECIISDLLQYSNVNNYVKYEFTQGKYSNKIRNFSKSKSFLGSKENLLTFYRLYFLDTGEELTNAVLSQKEIKERIRFVVDNIERVTGIKKLGILLTQVLELDMFFLNEDRHFNNLALIRNSESKIFRFAPIFDNGLCLLSDANEYKITEDVYKCMDRVKAKPFSIDLEEQAESSEALYGQQLYFNFDKSDVTREIEKYNDFYDISIIERVKTIIFNQMNKYKYLFERK